MVAGVEMGKVAGHDLAVLRSSHAGSVSDRDVHYWFSRACSSPNVLMHVTPPTFVIKLRLCKWENANCCTRFVSRTRSVWTPMLGFSVPPSYANRVACIEISQREIIEVHPIESLLDSALQRDKAIVSRRSASWCKTPPRCEARARFSLSREFKSVAGCEISHGTASGSWN